VSVTNSENLRTIIKQEKKTPKILFIFDRHFIDFFPEIDSNSKNAHDLAKD
jgi:hypothetical protein